jgi:polyamine oxidase
MIVDPSSPSVCACMSSQPNGPSTPVDMALDYYKFDYEFAEPPRVTSLQNTEPTPTNADFGEDSYFVADQRGFESLIHYIGSYYLSTDANGRISDRRVLLNKVVSICLLKKKKQGSSIYIYYCIF